MNFRQRNTGVEMTSVDVQSSTEEQRGTSTSRPRRILAEYWFRYFGRACVVFTLVLFAVATLPILQVWATVLAGGWSEPDGDILILLPGSSPDHGRFPQPATFRMEAAADAYLRGKCKTILITGGGPGVPLSARMRDVLVRLGVPPSAIILEKRATSTRENAVYTAEMLRSVNGRKTLMTSDFHMFRASRAFRRVGLDVNPWPVRDVRWRSDRNTEAWPALMDVLIEQVKIVYYLFRGWI